MKVVSSIFDKECVLFCAVDRRILNGYVSIILRHPYQILYPIRFDLVSKGPNRFDFLTHWFDFDKKDYVEIHRDNKKLNLNNVLKFEKRLLLESHSPAYRSRFRCLAIVFLPNNYVLKKFANLDNISRVYLLFGIHFNPLWHFWMPLGKFSLM